MTHNGFKNYESWSIGSWMDNDAETQELFAGMARRARDVGQLSQEIEAYWKDNAPELEGVYAQLLHGALSDVNWYELAERLMEDAEDEVIA